MITVLLFLVQKDSLRFTLSPWDGNAKMPDAFDDEKRRRVPRQKARKKWSQVSFCWDPVLVLKISNMIQVLAENLLEEKA